MIIVCLFEMSDMADLFQAHKRDKADLFPLVDTSHPGHVIHVAAQIAAIRGTCLKKVIKVTGENAKRLYRLPSSA